MTNGTFTISFKVTGLERKQIASTIGEAIGQEASYAGAPVSPTEHAIG